MISGPSTRRWPNPELRVWPGLRLFVRVAHDIILAGAGWVIMTVGPYLVLMLYPQLFFAELNTAPFLLLQISLTIVSVLGFVPLAEQGHGL